MINKILITFLLAVTYPCSAQDVFTIDDYRKNEYNYISVDKVESKHLNKEAEIINEILEIDQKIRDNSPVGSLQDIENKRRLDSLISEKGWIPTFGTDIKGVGAAIILVHQGYLTSKDFDSYYKLIVKECLEKKEHWMVALTVLEYRYQWLGSDLRRKNDPDTITIKLYDNNTIDTLYSTPYIAAMSKTLCSNSNKKLNITVNNENIKNQLEELLIRFKLIGAIPPEILEMIKKAGGHGPSELTTDRFSIKVDEKTAKNKIIYKFHYE
jgi:hypothetical protein